MLHRGRLPIYPYLPFDLPHRILHAIHYTHYTLQIINYIHMKRYSFCITFITALLGACLVGCHTQKKAVTVVEEKKTTIQADTTVLPLFPAEALYIIGREWECMHDSLSPKYLTPRAIQIRTNSVSLADYMEQRLLELYPERAYAGYIEKVEQMASLLIYAGAENATISNLIGGELPSPNQLNAHYAPSAELLSDSAEIAFIELNRQEQERLTLLNGLANQARFVGRSTLDSLCVSTLEEENFGITLLLWRGPRFFYRVMQSKERATHLAEYYYPGATAGGMKGDAYRHLCVNALLRTYVGLPMTYLIMDVFWEHAHPNQPCDRYMDLHNNIVGRQSHYEDFVQTAPTDSLPNAIPAWEQWAERIHAFVEDTTENAEFQHWTRESPSFIVIPQSQAVEQGKYIYWQH